MQDPVGTAEFRNVGGSFYDFELERFKGRKGEIVTPTPLMAAAG